MSDNKNIKLLADLFEVDESEITPDKALADLSWDSMNMLALIALFKSEYGTKLEPAKLRSFRTVGDILAEMK